MGILNPVAELNRPDSGKLILPQEAHRLKDRHSFFCPDADCPDEQRILRPAVSNQGTYFFRHQGDYAHDIRPETLFHKAAVRWFEGKTSFEIPAAKGASFTLERQTLAINAEKTVCEYRKLELLIPDVKLCTLGGWEFAVEIFVTNDISHEKRKRIHDFDLPVLRIDLSKFYKRHSEKCRVDLQFIHTSLDKLLTDLTLKSWVIPPTAERLTADIDLNRTSSKGDNTHNLQRDALGVGWVIAAIAGLLYFFWPKKRRTRSVKGKRKR